MDEQFLSNGNGSDGVVVLTNHAPIDAQASGSNNTNTVTANNPSFAAGQFIKIRQEKGSGYGNQEINKIQSYNSGTGVITTVNKLKHDYSSSGSSRAQVIVMPQYSQVTLSVSFSIKAWNGAVGGHLTFLCTGRVINNSGVTISGVGRGFRGGDRENSGSPPVNAEQGDSPTGDPGRSTGQNGLGGGGARDNNGGRGASGGGAGNVSQGGSGGSGDGTQTGGQQGAGIDIIDLLQRFIMGPGGGGGIGPGGNDIGGYGGSGGATFDIYCAEFINNGVFDVSGNNGNTISNYGGYTLDNGNLNPNTGGSQGSGGGAGSGGDGRVTCQKFTNTGAIRSNGGTGGSSSNNPPNPPGGNGSVGVITIRACSYTNTGSISGDVILQIGGHSYCGSGVQIL